MIELKKLFEEVTGLSDPSIEQLVVSGSNRRYFRLCRDERTLIGVQGTSPEENRAFIEMTQHFHKQGLPVPEFKIVSEDGLYYLQEDLGDTSLFEAIKKGRLTYGFSSEEKSLLRRTIEYLPQFQILGSQNFDFSVCYPQPEFNRRSVLWDLNYFKYYFLKPSGLEYQENLLEDQFDRFADILLREPAEYFMYRDFQSRNVMVRDDKLYFIDYQGGRKGPLHYDVASFLWQARARYGEDLREELLHSYFESLQKLLPVDEITFRKTLSYFVLFRLLQVLGAYGFRGYFEKKPHFLQSIPFAIDSLRDVLLQTDFSEMSYLHKLLKELVEMKQFKEMQLDKPLVVTIYSFSYKKGIPVDSSGNGGGYAFDCRAINNPGKYERYYTLTGLDEPVIRFLEDDGEIIKFLHSCHQLIDSSVKRYMERRFTNLMINFGCTGGQHRSVYAAQKTAEHIHEKFGVEVRLIHREQNIEQHFPGKIQFVN